MNIYENTYNVFLEKEKAFSKKFLENSEIFDESEYSLVKSIWLDQNLINEIYSVVDDVIQGQKINKVDLRFLVIGDFLFSLTSNDLVDPSELILKTTRNAYIYRIGLRAAINNMFDYDWVVYILIHKKLLIGLRVKKIINRAIVRTIDKKKKWSTTIYFTLEIKEEFLDQKHILGISGNPFKIFYIFKIGYCVGSFRNVMRMKAKKREMDNVITSFEGLEKAQNIGFILSIESYEITKKIIISEKTKLLNSVGCSNFEEYLDKVKIIIKDKTYSHKLFLGKEKIPDVCYKDIISTEIKVKNEFVDIISKFPQLISMMLMGRDIFEKLMYIPCFIDNRGRQYYATLLSPTFSILFRHLYKFNIQKKIENLEKSRFYKEILKYKNIVKKFRLETELCIYIIIVLFIEIGKFFVKNGSYDIRTEDMINFGIDNYTKKKIVTDFEENLYLQKMYFTIDKLLINKEIDENVLIFKDATASGLQNYGILLGYKEEKLKYLNLDNINWCDTYQYIIDIILKEKGLLAKRKYWKGTILRIPYNGKWYNCFINFIESLRKDGIEYNNFSEDEQKRVKVMHKDFYDAVKNNIKDEFYKKENKNLQIFKYSEWQIVSIDEYKINYNKARDKYTNTLYMLNDNIKSEQRALEANNMHYLDACLVKEILSEFEVITVHDCFGIRLCELHLVMDKLNAYYSEKIGKSTYSIHIII